MLHGVVSFVPNRVDGDQSVQAAVVSRLIKAGARVSKQLGSSTTHVVFLQKLLPSFQEQVQQDDLIKDLYERLEKVNSRAHIVSNLWVHASAESGSRANEDEFMIRKPTDPEDLNFYSCGMPTLKGQRRGSMRPPGVQGQRRRKSTPLPLPSEAFAFDADDFLFSSSQQINEMDAKPRDAGAAPGWDVSRSCDDLAADPSLGARLQGTKRSASTAQVENAGAEGSAQKRRTSLPAMGGFKALEKHSNGNRPGSKRSAVNSSAPKLLTQHHTDRGSPLTAGSAAAAAVAGGSNSKPCARAQSVPGSSSKARSAPQSSSKARSTPQSSIKAIESKAPSKGGVTTGQARASGARTAAATTPWRAPRAALLASPASEPVDTKTQAANAITTTPRASVAPITACKATPLVADTPPSLTCNGLSTAAPSTGTPHVAPAKCMATPLVANTSPSLTFNGLPTAAPASGMPTTSLHREATYNDGHTANATRAQSIHHATRSQSIHHKKLVCAGGDSRPLVAHHGDGSDSTPSLLLPPAKGQASTPRLSRARANSEQQQQQQQQKQDSPASTPRLGRTGMQQQQQDGHAGTTRLGRARLKLEQLEQQQQQQQQDGPERSRKGALKRKEPEQPPQEQLLAEVRQNRQRRSSGIARAASTSACLEQGPGVHGLPEGDTAATPCLHTKLPKRGLSATPCLHAKLPEGDTAATPLLLTKLCDAATPDAQPAAAPGIFGARNVLGNGQGMPGQANDRSAMKQGPSKRPAEGTDCCEDSCQPPLLQSPWQQQQHKQRAQRLQGHGDEQTLNEHPQQQQQQQQQHRLQELQVQGGEQALEEHKTQQQQQQQQQQQKLRGDTHTDQDLLAGREPHKGGLTRKRSVLWADRLTPDTSPCALLPVNPAFARTSTGAATSAINTSEAAPLAAAERQLTTAQTNGAMLRSSCSTHDVPATANLTRAALNCTPQHATIPDRTSASAPATCQKSGQACKSAAAAAAATSTNTTPLLPPQPSARQPTFHSTGKNVADGMGKNRAGSSSMPAATHPAPLSTCKSSTTAVGGFAASTPQCAAGRGGNEGLKGTGKRSSPPFGAPTLSPRLSPLGMLAVPKLKGSGVSGGARSVGEVGSAAAAAAAAGGSGVGAQQAGTSPSPGCDLGQHGLESYTSAAQRLHPNSSSSQALGATEQHGNGSHSVTAAAAAVPATGQRIEAAQACAPIIIDLTSSSPTNATQARPVLPPPPPQHTSSTSAHAFDLRSRSPVGAPTQARPDVLPLSPLPQHQYPQSNHQQQPPPQQQQQGHSGITEAQPDLLPLLPLPHHQYPRSNNPHQQQQHPQSNLQQQQQKHSINTHKPPSSTFPPAQRLQEERQECCVQQECCGGGGGGVCVSEGGLQRCQQLLQALKQQQLQSPAKQQQQHHHHHHHQRLQQQQQQQQILGPPDQQVLENSDPQPHQHLAPQPQTLLPPETQTTHRSTLAVSSSDAAAAAPSVPSHTAHIVPSNAASPVHSQTASAAPSHAAQPARPRKLRQATLSFAPAAAAGPAAKKAKAPPAAAAAGPAAKKAKMGDGMGRAVRAAGLQRQSEQQQEDCGQQQQQEDEGKEHRGNEQQQHQQQPQQQQQQQQREEAEQGAHEQQHTGHDHHEFNSKILQRQTSHVQQHQQHPHQQQNEHNQQQPSTHVHEAQPDNVGKRGTSTLADEDVAAALLTTPHRRVKFLAHSSVPTAFLATIQAAAQQLGGAHVVLEGYEDARASHLVIGAERRTLKVLLAIANGAHMVTPQWITASLAAGHWLPEADFQASVRFEAVASAVRSAMVAGAPRPRPLAHHLVCVHCPPPQPCAQAEQKASAASACHSSSSTSYAAACRRRGSSSGGSGSGTSVTRAALAAASAKAVEHRQGLQRLVVALGGRVVPPRACNLAVVSAGAPAPSCCPPNAVAVTEEWLLQLAETHTLPSTSAFNVE